MMSLAGCLNPLFVNNGMLSFISSISNKFHPMKIADVNKLHKQQPDLELSPKNITSGNGFNA